jgi:hypothetical protein
MEQLREGYARSREQRTNALPSPLPLAGEAGVSQGTQKEPN